MPPISSLPWHLVTVPTSVLIQLLTRIPAISIWGTSALIGFFPVHHRKAMTKFTPSDLPTPPSHTPPPHETPPSPVQQSTWGFLNHGWKRFKTYFLGYMKWLGGDKDAGRHWTWDIQYPQPEDVLLDPLRPDLNPYLKVDDPLQPQISEEQREAYALAAKKEFESADEVPNDQKRKSNKKKGGGIPKTITVSWDSYRRRDVCSGQNLVWNYLHSGDGTVPNALQNCPGFLRLLHDRGCAMTPTGTVCLGNQQKQKEDLNLMRYAYPNNTWGRLGNPLEGRKVDLHKHLKDTGEGGDANVTTTDMYVFDLGNGAVLNLGIDRDVADKEFNLTALEKDGILPKGVDIYGPDWKSEYDEGPDADDDTDAATMFRRSQFPGLIRDDGARRYRHVDLTKHVLSREEIKTMMESIASSFSSSSSFQLPLIQHSNLTSTTPLLHSSTSINHGQAAGMSLGTALLLFLLAFFGLRFFLTRRKSTHSRRNKRRLGVYNDASVIKLGGSMSRSRSGRGRYSDDDVEMSFDEDENEARILLGV